MHSWTNGNRDPLGNRQGCTHLVCGKPWRFITPSGKFLPTLGKPDFPAGFSNNFWEGWSCHVTLRSCFQRQNQASAFSRGRLSISTDPDHGLKEHCFLFLEHPFFCSGFILFVWLLLLFTNPKESGRQSVCLNRRIPHRN